MGQAVACASVTQLTRVRSLVGTSLGQIFSGFFLTCKRNLRKLSAQMSPNIIRPSSSFHIHLVSVNEYLNGVYGLSVRVVSEIAPALSWSLIRGGPPCPCVVKKICTVCDINLISSSDRSLLCKARAA